MALGTAARQPLTDVGSLISYRRTLNNIHIGTYKRILNLIIILYSVRVYPRVVKRPTADDCSSKSIIASNSLICLQLYYLHLFTKPAALNIISIVK